MDLGTVLKLINSPIRTKKRKGIKLIRGNFDKFKDLKEIVDILTKLLDEEDPIVKIEVQRTIIKLIEKHPNLVSELLSHLEKGLEEEDANVRFSTVSGFLRLVKMGLISDSSTLKTLIEKGLEDENPEVINSTLRLISYACEKGLIDVEEYSHRVFELSNRVDNKYTKLMIIEILLRKPKQLITDEIKEFIINEVMELAKDKDSYYRSGATRVIGTLIRNNLADERFFRTLIKKRLRDPSNTVKLSALRVIWDIGGADINNIVPYLDIVSNEILLKSRNKKLKLTVLELLHDLIDKLPRDLVFRYKLLKNISKVEKATVPKSPILAEIKKLSNQIMENKIGLTLEERIKKF